MYKRQESDTRYFLPPRKAIDLFTAFRYNCLKSILSHSFRDFFKKSQKSLEALEQFSRSHALYNRGLNMDGLTEQEIADKVGYKTASAVHKRIAKIEMCIRDSSGGLLGYGMGEAVSGLRQ